MDFDLLGANVRELLGIRPYNLSVAVWVGFLALFGIATDDGVVMATRIEQSMRRTGRGRWKRSAHRWSPAGGCGSGRLS